MNDYNDTHHTSDSSSELDQELPSKTTFKKIAKDITALGDDLIKLPEKQLSTIPLSEPLKEAITIARGMRSDNGKRRQRLFIGKLLRNQDIDPIIEAINQIKARDQAHVQQHHHIERWRDRLLANPQDASAFMSEYPLEDKQGFNQQLRAAVREQKAIKACPDHKQAPAPKETRKLFVLIRERLSQSSTDD